MLCEYLKYWFATEWFHRRKYSQLSDSDLGSAEELHCERGGLGYCSD